MTAYCRLCNQAKSQGNAFIACENCGSFACETHHHWFSHFRRAFCTDCVPQQTAQAAGQVSNATQLLAQLYSTRGALDEQRRVAYAPLLSLASAVAGDRRLQELLGLSDAKPEQVLNRLAELLERLFFITVGIAPRRET